MSTEWIAHASIIIKAATNITPTISFSLLIWIFISSKREKPFYDFLHKISLHMVQLGKSVKYYDDCEVTRYREKFIGKATIIVKEFRTDEKSAALYAWGIAICGPREKFDENEGTRRANGRADWVINRYEKWGCDFSDYQKRYSYKYNRKLLKENQLSLSEKDQFDSLDEIVATAEKAETTGSESLLEKKVDEPAPASTPAEVYNNPELTFVGPGPGDTGGCDATPYNGKKDEPKESAPAYEQPAPAPEPIPIPPAPVQAPEPTPLPPVAPGSARIINLADFFDTANFGDKSIEEVAGIEPRDQPKKRLPRVDCHTVIMDHNPDDYFSGDRGA
jgi:hypothetical protein